METRKGQGKEGVLPIAVFASGTGSNFRQLLAHSDQGLLERGRIVCLVSDQPGSGAVALAAERGLPCLALTHKAAGGRQAFEQAACAFLQVQNIAWVVLAGYMRLVGPTLLAAFSRRMINVHPSLLPQFPGLDAPLQALTAGVVQTGVTVHYVDAGLDTGEIIAQTPVAVYPDDTLSTLTARIHSAEHTLLPQVVRSLCT